LFGSNHHTITALSHAGTWLSIAVPTGLHQATYWTTISIDLVGVVTLLPGQDIDKTVATERNRTISITVSSLSSTITLLSALNQPIPASVQLTQVRATVTVIVVTVVALLTRLNEPVATPRHRADGRAGVGVDSVTVVALLPAVLLAVAAHLKPAGTGAAVTVVLAPVVALLTLLDDVVAADRATP
jgi:hypothetical protein